MAFKRDGDSKDWLGLLRKRRIAELFAEDIPEDEAILMKNGRFCCTVCSHRPIFDTPQMLAQHRKGKKHQQSTEAQLQNKLEVQYLIQKRQHEQYLKDGKVTHNRESYPSSNTSGQHLLNTSKRYEPTVKKPKLKTGERRPILQLNEGLDDDVQTIAQYQRKQRSYEEDVKILKPYKSSRQNSTETSLPHLPSHSHTTNSSKSHMEQRTCTSTQAKNTTTYDSVASRTSGGKDKPKSDSNLKTVDSLSAFNNFSSQANPVYVHHHPQRSGQKIKHKINQEKTPLSEADLEKKKKADLYLQARGAGWKKSLDGIWVRDEDVEFDSDEEPPDLP